MSQPYIAHVIWFNDKICTSIARRLSQWIPQAWKSVALKSSPCSWYLLPTPGTIAFEWGYRGGGLIWIWMGEVSVRWFLYRNIVRTFNPEPKTKNIQWILLFEPWIYDGFDGHDLHLQKVTQFHLPQTELWVWICLYRTGSHFQTISWPSKLPVLWRYGETKGSFQPKRGEDA